MLFRVLVAHLICAFGAVATRAASHSSDQGSIPAGDDKLCPLTEAKNVELLVFLRHSFSFFPLLCNSKQETIYSFHINSRIQ